MSDDLGNLEADKRLQALISGINSGETKHVDALFQILRVCAQIAHSIITP